MKMNRAVLPLSLAFSLLTAFAFVASAQPAETWSASDSTQLRLPRLISNGMVIQRDARVPVWGWAPPGARVAVTLHGRTERVTVGRDSTWKVTFPAMSAGGPYDIVVEAGGSRIAVHDVLVGDVWVASGQSNMTLTVSAANDAAREIASASDQKLRHFAVPQSFADAPAKDLAGGSWVAADSQHVGQFTAVGYYFARELRKTVGVPIGLIHTSWAGSNIETWMSRQALALGDSAWNAIIQRERRERARDATIRESLTARLGSLPTADRGFVNGTAAWADPALDDSTWTTIPVPSSWGGAGWDGLDGVAWYRTAFVLTADEAAHGVKISLGPIEDRDMTWVNGVEIGRTSSSNIPRLYTVPSSTLRAGRNVLAVRVESRDNGGDGGLNGKPAHMYVEVAGARRSLQGMWRFAVGEVALTTHMWRINKIPTLLYNRMLHPLLRVPIKGVIWYQGESNANNDAQAAAYRAQFVTLIRSWRSEWLAGRADFPFLWVQLPNYGAVDSVPPVRARWAMMRESQAAALALPKTRQAVAIDIGKADNQHPRNKQDVGRRLALAALSVAYGQSVVYSGPTYRRHAVRDGRIVIEFDHIGGGLVSRAPATGRDSTLGDRVTGFAVAGANRRFVWAEARIVDNRVLVWSDAVPNPVAVRYAWANSPENPSLYNGARLPAAPFRTDAW